MRGALDSTTAAAPTTAQLEESVTHVAAAAKADPVAAGSAVVTPASPQAPVIVSAGRVQAAAGASGLKALVPHAHAEATS